MNISRILTRISYSVNQSYQNFIKHSTLTMKRTCSTLPDSQPCNELEGEEIEIPVPWGHISCVHWGPKNKQPIVALHGWQDNAGTWKALVPLLNNDISILAVDFPGHGKSSWYPHGMFYNIPDNAVTIQRVVNHFAWKSVTLLGHSMGAISSFVYASLKPEAVNKMVLLDNLQPITGRRKNHIEHASNELRDMFKVEQRNLTGGEPPSYSLEEMIERYYLGAHKSIDKDKCHLLLERGIKKSSSDPNKYYFARDSRLKHNLHLGYDPTDVRAMVPRLNMPILHLKFDQATYFEPKENFDEIANMLKQSNKNFETHLVSGKHHAHVNNPQDIAPYINQFLLKYD